MRRQNGSSLVVMKFGGTSVEDATAIDRVAQIVRSRERCRRVVVVSALAKVTDQLVLMGQKAAAGDTDSIVQLVQAMRERHLETAKQLLGTPSPRLASKIEETFDQLKEFLGGVAAVRELSPRSSDYLLSFGELISSEIVTVAFAARELEAVWVDSRKCVVTDGNHTRALPLLEETRVKTQSALGAILSKGQVPVMGGFIAATCEGTPSTLGRGGSDFSAAIIGAVLDAARIEIWTDVEGMMTTDPRLCPDARTIQHISFNEAAELAYFGAKVLHPATLLPAIQKNIPVYVLNSRNPKSTGTEITEHAPPGKEMFRAITAKTGISIVNVVASRGVMVHGFLKSVFEALDRHSASVDIVAISEVSLSFTIESKRLPQTLIADLEQLADVTCDGQQAIICLVGEDIHGKPGIAASVFSTVADARVNIRMISQGASEINISFVVKESDVPQAVRHLHARFFPHVAKATTGRNGAVRGQADGAKVKGQARSANHRRKAMVVGKSR
jgi:aspartate kinase